MGFLDAIFHAAAISMVEAHREVRKEEKREKDTFTYCLDVQDSLNNLLQRTGSPAFYVANTRQANSEINKMKNWMNSYKEYLSLGGIAKAIKDIENIDNELQWLKDPDSCTPGVMFWECVNLQADLNNLMQQNGSPAFYFADTDQTALEIPKMQSWKKKYQEYLSLGGRAENIKDVEKIDENLQLLQYLAVCGKICEQNQYLEAAETIRGYLNIFHMSLKGMKEQLESDGEFDDDQITWALSACHVNWDEEAKKKASQLLKFESEQGPYISVTDENGQEQLILRPKLTYSKLIERIEGYGFTANQAKEAVDACWQDSKL